MADAAVVEYDAPHSINYSVSRLDERSFAPSPLRQDGVLERELGIAGATGGHVSMAYLRTEAPVETTGPWLRIDGDVRVLHCLKGSWEIGVGTEDIRLEEGSCVSIPGGAPFQERRASAGLEVLEIVLGSSERIPCSSAHDRGAANDRAKLVVSHLQADSWKNGAGRREFLAYRNLGVAEATGGRLHVNGIRAIRGMVGSTGWHRHSCGLQVVYQLGGWGRIEFVPGELVLIDRGVCMCIPPERAHAEHGYSQDSELIEVTIGEIGTTLCDPPAA